MWGVKPFWRSHWWRRWVGTTTSATANAAQYEDILLRAGVLAQRHRGCFCTNCTSGNLLVTRLGGASAGALAWCRRSTPPPCMSGAVAAPGARCRPTVDNDLTGDVRHSGGHSAGLRRLGSVPGRRYHLLLNQRPERRHTEAAPSGRLLFVWPPEPTSSSRSRRSPVQSRSHVPSEHSAMPFRKFLMNRDGAANGSGRAMRSGL